MSTLVRRLVVASALIAAVAFGFVLGRLREVPAPGAAPAHEHADVAEMWTCAMHPEIRRPGPGSCPLCGMDLIPVEAGASGAGDAVPSLELSESARRLAEIRTVAVRRAFPTVEVRMVGEVDYDETRLSYITSYVSGRLERLYVDHTGAPVDRGDHLVDIYSPELLAAQEELLQALAARRRMAGSELEVMRRTSEATVAAAREKLRLLGLLPQQIAEIEHHGVADDVVTLYSPTGGIVIDKAAQPGLYVDTGTPIYTIADLGRVWIRLEAYESDIGWVHFGQQVTFSVEALPGETFQGRISFVEPTVDPTTRTVRLRVNVDNADGRLKPGMLVRARARAQLAGFDRVYDPELAGKWIGPMHPWVIEDGPGSCDICGMPLVRAESLGFVPRDEPDEAPLVVPATAPLVTGTRAVVYVERFEQGRPIYEGREVELGTRAGDVYIVRSGLSEGERVVIEGAFKIDSALQIQAKPSMMSPEASGADWTAPQTQPGSGPQTRPQSRPQTRPQTRPQSQPAAEPAHVH